MVKTLEWYQDVTDRYTNGQTDRQTKLP